MCDHGFVVRDIQGDDRFLCRECNRRFPFYPQRETWQIALNKKIRWDLINDALKTYTDTFVDRINKPRPGYVRTKGTAVGQVTYTFPTTGAVTESVSFAAEDLTIENNHE